MPCADTLMDVAARTNCLPCALRFVCTAVVYAFENMFRVWRVAEGDQTQLQPVKDHHSAQDLPF